MLNITNATIDDITPVPTAEAIGVALSASPYMDHVVNAWIQAWANRKAAEAVSDYISSAPSTGNPFVDAYQADENPVLTAAKVAFDAAYKEVRTRWVEYKDKA